MLVDTHVHISHTPQFYMSEEMVEEMMKRYPVDYVILSNGDSTEVEENTQKILDVKYTTTQEESFRMSLAFARKHPGKIGVMPWIKPLTEQVNDTFISMLEENKDILKGIKFHAYYSAMSTDDVRMEPYVDLARNYKIPVLVHTGVGIYDDVDGVYRMAKKNPDVKFIMGHMGLGTDNRHALDLMAEASNLYGDTAWVPTETVLEAQRRFGSKRMFFGSDSPIDGVDTYRCNKEGHPSMYIEYFERLEERMGTAAYEDLMFRNAIETFRIKELT